MIDDATPRTVTIVESDRQLVLLALATLALTRPGWLFACQQAADCFGGVEAQQMFKEFHRLNADRVHATAEATRPLAEGGE